MMPTSVYKYVAIFGVALALMVGAFFYGIHLGSASGKAALSSTVASLNAKAAATLQADLATQQAQDAARLKAAETAQEIAQAAAQTAQTLLTSQTAQIRGLQHVPIDQKWLATAIPPDIRRVLNGAAGGGKDSHPHAHAVRGNSR